MTELETAAEFNVRKRSFNRVGRHLIWCGLGAAMLALAFPMPGWRWVAWFALTPIAVLAARSSSARRLAWTSFIVFYLWWLVMLRWLIPVTVGGYFAVTAALAVYAMLAIVLLHWLVKHYPRVPLSVLLPMSWVTMELARGYLFAGGFGWLAIGHSQGAFMPEHGVSRIAQIADIFGVAGVSVLVAGCSGMLADIITKPWVEYDTTGKRIGSRTIRISIGLWLLAFVLSFFYGSMRIGETPDVLRPGPVVAIVQTNVPQSNKSDSAAPEEVAMEWRRLLELSRQAAQSQPRPDIIVWPETVVPANLNRESVEFYQREGWLDQAAYHSETSELARQLQIPLLVGAPAKEDWQLKALYNDDRMYWVGRRRFNSAYLYDREGVQFSERYDKIHRVPFGEYIPWVSAVPMLQKLFLKYFSPYDFDYTLQPGERIVRFPVAYEVDAQMLPPDAGGAVPAADETAGEQSAGAVAPADAAPVAGEQHRLAVKAVTPICFEDTVPRVVRRLIYENGEKRASLIINMTNDGWFEGSSQPWQHLQHASFRNIENRVAAARAVNTGCSGFVDSLGRVVTLAMAEGRYTSVEAVAALRMPIDTRETIWGLIGHWPMLIMIAATCVLAVLPLVMRWKTPMPVQANPPVAEPLTLPDEPGKSSKASSK